MLAIELDKGREKYRQIADAPGPQEARLAVQDICEDLVRGVAETAGLDPVKDRILYVCILRGGALLLPAFMRRFSAAHYCFVAMCRDEKARVPKCTYKTDPPSRGYENIVYLDCIAATGNTILASRGELNLDQKPQREYAAVISSSAIATERLVENGIHVIGFSLREKITSDQVVVPDFGRLDAGDIFSGVGI